MSLPTFNHAAQIARALLGTFAGLGLVAVSMSLAAQHRAAPSPVTVLTHAVPEGPGCGQWGSLSLQSCIGGDACRPESIDADTTILLYDRLDVQIDTLVAEACESRQCPGFELRNDENHIDCERSGETCMNRSLVYRCTGPRSEPAGQAQERPMQLAVAPQAAQQVMAAARPEVDVAFSGPLRLGTQDIEWGNSIRLDPAQAVVSEDGRCRFRYRYGVVNQGVNDAGAHVNRVRLGEHVQLAEQGMDGLAAGTRRTQSGSLTLWSGEHMLYAYLDNDEQLNDVDRTNNVRRVRVELADGCADPRPRARPPGGTSTRHIPRPTGRHSPPEPERTGTRAPTTAPPPSRGNRAAPPPQGKPAPGPDSKPIPQGAGDCRPVLSATRVTGLTRTGARTTAIAAWEASAIAMYGSGFRWDSARDQSTACNLEFGWTCTVRARPCRN